MEILCFLLVAYGFVLLARIILSWIPAAPEGLRPVVSFLYAVTEPVLRLARPYIPPLRVGAVALDLSILLVFILLSIVQQVVCGAVR